jgi:hypothetical protein
VIPSAGSLFFNVTTYYEMCTVLFNSEHDRLARRPA